MATASLRRRAAGWRRRERRGRQRLFRASLHQALALGGWALLLLGLAWLVAAGIYGLVNV
jgi:hypothetical protein